MTETPQEFGRESVEYWKTRHRISNVKLTAAPARDEGTKP